MIYSILKLDESSFSNFVNSSLNNNNGSKLNSNTDEKTFGRTKILLDPAQIEDMERKRRANLAHKREIEAQIEEKRRRKQLEDELQELDNQKVECEAREQATNQLYSNEVKKQQPQFKNLDRMFNQGDDNQQQQQQRGASVLQGESNRYDKDSQTARLQVTDNRTSEIYKAMQNAELAAAEEKHRRLLKKLQKGGHDTRQLERRFAEYKARLLGNPAPPNASTGDQFEIDSPGTLGNHQNGRGNVQQPQQMRANHHNHETTDRGASEEEEKKRQALNMIFQMMRENTKNAMPAELSEEDLKQLING